MNLGKQLWRSRSLPCFYTVWTGIDRDGPNLHSSPSFHTEGILTNQVQSFLRLQLMRRSGVKYPPRGKPKSIVLDRSLQGNCAVLVICPSRLLIVPKSRAFVLGAASSLRGRVYFKKMGLAFRRPVLQS